MNATQLEFLTAGGATGQNAKLIDYMLARRGRWIPMPELVDHLGSYCIHSRAADARKLGYDIENRRERVDGKVHSYYRLV